jgi:hypothetical protein
VTLLAGHAGHVLLDAIYLLPLVVLLGLVVAGKLRERREARRLRVPEKRAGAD